MLSSLLLGGCTTRKLGPNESLLVHNRIIGAADASQEEEAATYIRQKPNGKLFGLFRFNLYIYNLANTGKKRGYKEKLKAIGDAAVIVDSIQTAYSAKQINQFLFSKGYFNNQVSFSSTTKRKKTQVDYRIELNSPYSIDSIGYIIIDNTLDSIYKSTISESLLRRGDRYDESMLQQEQERIYSNMRNNGYYKFLRQYITYRIDSSFQNNTVRLVLKISNPENQLKHQQYTINHVYLHINPDQSYARNVMVKDTMNLGHFYYFDPENRFNPNAFSKMLFIKDGERYAQRNTDLTYNRLGDLGVFKFSNISFQEDSVNQKLNASINLTPSRQFSLRPEIEGTFNSGNLGANGSLGYSDKNVFRGAELFELGLKGGLETRRSLADNNLFLYRRQIAGSANLYFPKLFVPFLKANYRFSNPRSFVSLNFAYEKRENFFFRRYLNMALGYDWRDTRTQSHYIKLLDVNVVSSALSPELTQSLINQGNFYLLRSFVPYFSLGTQYRYIENQADPKKPYKDYFYFRFTIDIAGNSLNAIKQTFKLNQDSTGAYKVFNLIYYQYFRPEIDIRYYTFINTKNNLAFRFNPGIGFAYGNSKNLPFEKQFFVGGSNSLRAWHARQLGPGTYVPTDALKNNLFLLDRSGDIKLELNAEYRFQLLRSFLRAKLNGATFVDAGNVWYRKKETNLPGSEFKLSRLYYDIAIGTGLGVRLDYTFFIFRFDVGLKLKDPFYTANEGWVIERFSDRNFKAANSYTFLSYNFGIGYPF